MILLLITHTHKHTLTGALTHTHTPSPPPHPPHTRNRQLQVLVVELWRFFYFPSETPQRQPACLSFNQERRTLPTHTHTHTHFNWDSVIFCFFQLLAVSSGLIYLPYLLFWVIVISCTHTETEPLNPGHLSPLTYVIKAFKQLTDLHSLTWIWGNMPLK